MQVRGIWHTVQGNWIPALVIDHEHIIHEEPGPKAENYIYMFMSSMRIFPAKQLLKKTKKNCRRLRSSTDTGDALTKTECVSALPTVNNDDISWRQNKKCNQKADGWDQRWPTDPPTYQEQSLAGIIIGGWNEYLKPKRKNQQSCGLVCWWIHTSPQHWLRSIHLLSLNRWENHVVTDGRPFFCTADEVSVVTVHCRGPPVNTIIQMSCLGVLHQQKTQSEISWSRVLWL